MPAGARILDEIFSFAYPPYTMTKNAAPVSGALEKNRARLERIAGRGNQKLMTTGSANIFMESIPVCQTDKLMAAEEAREPVTDMRVAAASGEAGLYAITTL
jgi:hypothetical protein